MTHTNTNSAETFVSVTMPGGSVYSASGLDLARAIEDYLPTSTERLRAIVEDRAGHSFDGIDLGALLVVLADFDSAARALLSVTRPEVNL